jgi:hypothetical protein
MTADTVLLRCCRRPAGVSLMAFGSDARRFGGVLGVDAVRTRRKSLQRRRPVELDVEMVHSEDCDSDRLSETGDAACGVVGADSGRVGSTLARLTGSSMGEPGGVLAAELEEASEDVRELAGELLWRRMSLVGLGGGMQPRKGWTRARPRWYTDSSQPAMPRNRQAARSTSA